MTSVFEGYGHGFTLAASRPLWAVLVTGCAMLRTVILATLPLLAAILATAAIAVNVDAIMNFMFGGPAAGWQRLVVIGLLFLPIGLALALAECFIDQRCRGFGKRKQVR